MQQRKFREWQRGKRTERTPDGTYVMVTKQGPRFYAKFREGKKNFEKVIQLSNGRYLTPEQAGDWALAAQWVVNYRLALRNGGTLVSDEQRYLMGSILRRVEQLKLDQENPHEYDTKTLVLRLRRLIAHFGEDFDVRVLTSDHLREYVRVRREETSRRGARIMQCTAVREVKIINTGLRDAGIVIPGLIWPKVGVYKKLAQQSAKPRNRETIKLFMDALAVYPWLHDICSFVLQTGLRREELFRVRREWYDAQNSRLQIDPKIKTEGETWIELTPSAKLIIERALVGRRPIARTRSVDPGLIWGKRQPSKLMTEVCRKHGIEPVITMRDLRASFGRLIYDMPNNEGGGIYGAMRALRHTNIETTKRYLNISESEGRSQVLKTLDSAWK